MDLIEAIGAAGGVTARYEREDDKAFLMRLFEANRGPEFARLSSIWQAQMVEHQFDLQYRHYKSAFPTAHRLIIEFGGEAIGRLIVDVGGQYFHIVDIGLLPHWQNKGQGTALLKCIFALIASPGQSKEALLRVAETNRAARLYRRLGFRTLYSEPPYLTMIFCPKIQAQRTADPSKFLDDGLVEEFLHPSGKQVS